METSGSPVLLLLLFLLLHLRGVSDLGLPLSFENGACRTVHTYRCVRACIAQSTEGDDDSDGTDDYYGGGGGGGVGYSLPSWAEIATVTVNDEPYIFAQT